MAETVPSSTETPLFHVSVESPEREIWSGTYRYVDSVANVLYLLRPGEKAEVRRIR